MILFFIFGARAPSFTSHNIFYSLVTSWPSMMKRLIILTYHTNKSNQPKLVANPCYINNTFLSKLTSFLFNKEKKLWSKMSKNPLVFFCFQLKDFSISGQNLTRVTTTTPSNSWQSATTTTTTTTRQKFIDPRKIFWPNLLDQLGIGRKISGALI